MRMPTRLNSKGPDGAFVKFIPAKRAVLVADFSRMVNIYKIESNDWQVTRPGWRFARFDEISQISDTIKFCASETFLEMNFGCKTHLDVNFISFESNVFQFLESRRESGVLDQRRHYPPSWLIPIKFIPLEAGDCDVYTA